MKRQSSLLLLFFFHCSLLLHAQSGTHITCDDIKGKVIFYGEGTAALKEISYKSQYIAEQELLDAGQYDEEHYYHLSYQSVEVYEDSIAVLKNFPGSDFKGIEQTTIFNSSGELIREIRLNLKNIKNRSRGRLSKDGNLYLSMDESAIHILDLTDFKLCIYLMSDSDKPDFNLSYHDTWIQDFFISHNNLHVVLEQTQHDDFSANPRNYLMEIIWHY